MLADAEPLSVDRRPPETPSGRRRISLNDLFRMMEQGIIVEGERSELIEGELFVMPSEGELHVEHLDDLMDQFLAQVGPELRVRQRGVLNRQPDTQLSPDLAIWPRQSRFHDLTAPNALLVVEVSDTTARGDKREKAPLYARMCLRELWIMDVPRRQLLVYRDAAEGVWPEPTPYRPSEVVSPLFDPAVVIRVPG